MPVVQFQKDYRVLMRRYRRPADVDTCRVLNTMDQHAKRLEMKDISKNAKETAVRKLGETMKVLERRILEDLKEMKKNQPEALKQIDDDVERAAYERATRALNTALTKMNRTLKSYVLKASGQEEPAELPASDFDGKYLEILKKYQTKPVPAVEQALKKLDENNEPEKVTALYKEMKKELDEQLDEIAAEMTGGKADVKRKDVLKRLTTDLSKFREELKLYDKRVFLINRLKGG